MSKGDIAVIGLAVMGENLARNIESKGFKVVVYNRNSQVTRNFLNSYNTADFIGAFSFEEIRDSLKKPRKAILMIKAGNPVDMVIEELLRVFEPGDIIIDGGNSHYPDTIRRTLYVESKGLLYIGAGISGGEEGALKGPSIMPGGSEKAWPEISPIFQSIAAKTDNGEVCCDWVGSDGSGHFVKMVHNGIEYGDIQLITEVYQIMRDYLGMKNSEMSSVFSDWNQSELNSYLIEITAKILAYKDESGHYLIDNILDSAGQKGTGKWTVTSALEEGEPLTLIGEAVFSRFLSAKKTERIMASNAYETKIKKFTGDKSAFLDALKAALYSAKIISYTQGFSLLKVAAINHNWHLDFGNIALLWRGGCIIRSAFLGDIKAAYNLNPELENLLLDPFFMKKIKTGIIHWRKIVAEAVLAGIPIPALSSALTYFDGYTTKNLPANLLQAQRDFFGAHTYERIDKPRGKHFHTNWTGSGGKTSSSTYDV